MKDIRLVKDKESGMNKDFAFVEFHTLEDSALVLERAKIEKVRVKGVSVFVSYSKYKRPE